MAYGTSNSSANLHFTYGNPANDIEYLIDGMSVSAGEFNIFFNMEMASGGFGEGGIAELDGGGRGYSEYATALQDYQAAQASYQMQLAVYNSSYVQAHKNIFDIRTKHESFSSLFGHGWGWITYGPEAPNASMFFVHGHDDPPGNNQGGNHILNAVGSGTNAIGFISTTFEFSYVCDGMWKGTNGKWNSLNWGGNRWTGARTNALSKAGYFKLASRGLFIVGTGISLYQGGNALLKGDYAGATKSGLDIGMSAFATFGGPFGWIFGSGYFALDALGAFDRPISIPFSPSVFPLQDKTSVNKLLIPYEQ
jgi:hypothetical protein